MATRSDKPSSPRSIARFIGMLVIFAALGGGARVAAAQEKWPPYPQLAAATAAADATPLPTSISTELLGQGEYRCTFRFSPPSKPGQVVLAGTFNGWDRQACPLKGPNADGEWTGQIVLREGVYEYKFLVDDAKWCADPTNQDRIPDGFGGYNSFVRLGRLAQMRASEAKLGNGKIDPLGLAHRPPQPLYVQPLSAEAVSIRYRTLAHDVQHVWLAVRGGEMTEMRTVAEGPLFAWWEARIPVPSAQNSRSPNIRSVEYTFVLDDGAGRVGDPYPYRSSFTEAGLFDTPHWAREAIWYQILLDRFRNGNSANDPGPVRPWTSDWFEPSPWEGKDGQTLYDYVYDRFYSGDLDGLEAELPYLKALGINSLYLTPVFKSPSYHKYDTQNHVHIDDHFGTKGDYDAVAAQENLLDPATWQWTASDQRFVTFLATAHWQGFKVILDGVFNHVSTQHPAFQDVLKNGKSSRFADWFDVISWEPFHYHGWADFAHMPVLRKSRAGFASPAVQQYFFAITRRWMDPNGDGDPHDGIDGWRLDVPNDIPRPFWAEWRTVVKKLNPDALIIGEIWDRADEYLDGRHFDAVTNYEFARVAVKWLFDRKEKITASDAACRLAELRLAYPTAATYSVLNLVDSHDTDRLASMALNPDREYGRQNKVQGNNPEYDNAKPPPEAYTRARLAALLQATYVGAPLIYYGDEAGMWGASDPTSRKPMLWKDLEPYAKGSENFVLEDQLAFYKRMLALRNEHPALRTGAFETLLADDAADVWAFLRSDDSERVLVVLNASGTARDVRIPLPAGAPPSWNTVFGGTGPLSATADGLAVHVPPVRGVVFQTGSK